VRFVNTVKQWSHLDILIKNVEDVRVLDIVPNHASRRTGRLTRYFTHSYPLGVM
jgi:hypothetical protein